jgi:transposase
MKFTKENKIEIKEALAKAENVKIYKRLQIISLFMEGKAKREVMAITGATRNMIFRLLKQYQSEGIKGLQFNYVGGNRQKLSTEKEREALDILEEKAAKGNYLRIADLQAEFEKITGKQYNLVSFWYLLRRHKWRKLSPRGKHPKAADEAACEAVKKLTLNSIS